MDFDNMSLNDLEHLYDDIGKVIKEKRNEEQAKAWEAFKTAYFDYVNKYGSITIELDSTTEYLDQDSVFIDLGKIDNTPLCSL